MGQYYYIGIIGLINVGILCAITLWRVAQCIEAFESVGFSGVAFRRKFALHICLLLATMVDIPLMISFIVLEQYENFTYSFHKLEAAFIFAAFSITIGDWGSVLFDIREETQVPFAFRKATLLTANVINFGISITNFFFCITSTGDMSSITNSVVYQLGEFVQVILTFVIMVMLLHTGLKLAWRIRGVTGGNSNNSGNMYNKIPKTSSASARGSEGIHSSRASSSRNSMSTVQYPSSNRSSALTGISESAHGPSGSVKDSSDSESSSVNPLLEASITPTSPIQSQTPRKHPVGVPKSYAPALYNQNQSNSYMSNSNGTSNSKRYVNRQRTATGNSAVSYHSSAYSNGFNHALSRLNGVMAICTICFVLQITMSGLNIILGYDNDADRYICGIYLFWTLYEWVPLWGTILSLLFLSRTAMHNSRNRTGTNRSMVSDDTASTLDYTNSSRGQHPSNPSASRRQPNNSNTTMMYDDTSITAPLVEEGISDEETDMSEGTLEGMSDGSGISGERRSLYETPAQKIQNNAYYTDITQNDGEHYMDDEEDQDVDSRMRLTQATCITEDDIGPFRNRTDRTGPYHLNDTPTDSMQNQSDLYNYDIQNAMTGGNYSYRYSTMTNNQETNDNV